MLRSKYGSPGDNNQMFAPVKKGEFNKDNLESLNPKRYFAANTEYADATNIAATDTIKKILVDGIEIVLESPIALNDPELNKKFLAGYYNKVLENLSYSDDSAENFFGPAKIELSGTLVVVSFLGEPVVSAIIAGAGATEKVFPVVAVGDKMKTVQKATVTTANLEGLTLTAENGLTEIVLLSKTFAVGTDTAEALKNDMYDVAPAASALGLFDTFGLEVEVKSGEYIVSLYVAPGVDLTYNNGTSGANYFAATATGEYKNSILS